jgi:hypothetical protein
MTFRPRHLSVSSVALYARCPAQCSLAMLKYGREADMTQRSRGTVEVICEQCGTAFFTFPSRVGRKKFCSRRCLGLSVGVNRGASLAERLSAGLIPNAVSGCLEWSGSRTPEGYGRISVQGAPELTHRVAWALANRPLTDNEWVLHRCDNPPCCRLDHLFLGDNAVNQADSVKKGRNAVGERNGASKLTWKTVREIRSRYQPYRVSKRQLAEEYGVSLFVIACVLKGSTWKEPE